MPAPNTKVSSEFVQAALELDAIFTSLERLSNELTRLTLDSDKGMKRALILLDQFTNYSQQLEPSIQGLAQALIKAQELTQKAAQVIGQRALAVQERKQQIAHMQARYATLGDMVRQVTAALEQIRRPAGSKLSIAEEAELGSSMAEFYGQLGKLIDEIGKFKDEATRANMKALANNAASLRQTLQAAQRRLNILVDRYHPPQSYH